MEIKGHIQHAVKTNDEWLALNPILRKGERVEVSFNPPALCNSHKIGDGVTRYADLVFGFAQGKNASVWAQHGAAMGGYAQAGTTGYQIVTMSSHSSVDGDDTLSNIILESGYYIINDADWSDEKTNLILGEKYSVNIYANAYQVGTVTGVEVIANSSQVKINVAPYFHPKNWSKLDATNKSSAYANSFIFFTTTKPGYLTTIPIGTPKGTNASSFGYGTRAYGESAHAHGFETIAGGKNATSIGNRCQSMAYATFASGVESVASAELAFVHGKQAVASAKNAIALGHMATASGDNALALGHQAQASGKWSTSLGYKTQSKGQGSFAVGYETIAEHNHCNVMGRGLQSGRAYQTVVGRYNAISNKALFIVAYGGSASAPKNVFEVQDDGRATVAADPKNSLDVVTKQYADAINTKVEQLYAQFADVEAELILINEGGIE